MKLSQQIKKRSKEMGGVAENGLIISLHINYLCHVLLLYGSNAMQRIWYLICFDSLFLIPIEQVPLPCL